MLDLIAPIFGQPVVASLAIHRLSLHDAVHLSIILLLMGYISPFKVHILFGFGHR